MVESRILYDQLCDADSQEETERTLTRLIHAVLEDGDISITHSAANGVQYKKDWVDHGRFTIDAYSIRRGKDENSWKIHMGASYTDYLIDNQSDADFHAKVEGHVCLKLTIQCGPDAFTGDASVYVFPQV